MEILLFKDKLFEDFIKVLKNKNIDFKGYIIDEIKYKWANFLKINVTSSNNKLDKNKIENEFLKFKAKIEELLKGNIINEKFENKFYQTEEGLYRNRCYEEGLIDYF